MLQRQCAISSSRGLLIGLVVLICTIATWVSINSAHAQTGNLAVSIDGFSSQDWPQAQTVLTVLDSTGKPVEGLTKEDVRAQVDGTDVEVTSVSRGVDSNLPSFVVLAIDTSAGMAGAPLDQAKLATHQFIDALGPQDSVAILAYSDSPNLVQPFTQDRAAAHAAIDGLGAGGTNDLYRAATQSVLLGAASAQSGRRAVVLLSSGTDDTQGDPRQSLVAAKGLGVPVFIMGLGDAIDRPYLEQLTAAGGGRFTETSAPEGLPALYSGVSELLRNQYVVNLDASSLDIDTSNLVTLHFDVTAGASTGSTERIVCPANICASFRDLKTGAKLAETQTIAADVVSAETIQSVSLIVDGQTVEALRTAPYEFTIDPTEFDTGDHTFALAVTTSSSEGTFGELSVQFESPSSSGAGFPLMPVMLVLLIAVIVLVFVFLFLRRRSRRGDSPQPSAPAPEPIEPISIMIAKNRARQLTEKAEDLPPPPPADLEPVLGYLVMTGGPLSGQTFAVGAKPISIGSGHRCQIQLPAELDGYDVPSEFARVWIRGEQLMVHEIRRLTAMGAVGGQWEMLSNHDTFAIGPCAFRFDLDEFVEPGAPEPVPNVLREKSPGDESPSSPALTTATPIPIAPTAPAALSSEPIPNIFRDPPEGEHQDADEPAAEQAAGG